MKKSLFRILSFAMALLMVLSLAPQTALPVFAEGASGDALTALAGKKLSILGDSISTWHGVSNDGTVNTSTAENWGFYNTTSSPAEKYSITDRSQTWWQQTADQLGMEVLVNNSSSGSFLATDNYSATRGAEAAWKDRCVQLHDNNGTNPDVIAFYLGTNDFTRVGQTIKDGETVIDTAKELGSAAETLAKTELTEPVTVMDAYAICLQKMTAQYPDAQVYCFTLLPAKSGSTDTADFNADIKALAAAYSVNVVDLYNCGVTADNFDSMMGDAVHPNDKGMDAITAAFKSALVLNNCDTFNVTYNLAGVNTAGLPAAVISGNTLSAALGISADQTLYVTNANGEAVDYTYANGVLTVENVTSDLTVSRYNHGNHEGWTVWTEATKNEITKDLEANGGKIVFNAGDLNRISSPIDLNGKEVTVCLNGQRVTLGEKCAFTLTNGAKLTLCDCTASGVGAKYTAGSIKFDINETKTTDRTAGIIAQVNGADNAVTMYDGILNGAGKDNNAAGSEAGGLIHVNGSSTVKLYGGKLHNFTSAKGGAVCVKTGTLLVKGNVLFDNLKSTQRGGAIFVQNGTANISDATFTNCSVIDCTNFTSSYFGGAICGIGAQMTIDGNTTISNCSVSSSAVSGCGGAIYVNGTGSKLTVGGNTNISSCFADKQGGAIYAYQTEILLKDKAKIYDCNATGSAGAGGAIYAHTNTVTIQDQVKITDCDATTGGVIHQANSNKVYIKGGTFTNNTSSSHGGVAYIASGDMDVTGGTFTSNKSTGAYGGVFCINAGTLDIDGTNGLTISGNYAKTGGGALSVKGGATTVKNCSITNNSAGWGGGAVFTEGTGTLLLQDVTITGNYAPTSAGAVCVQDNGRANTNPQTTLKGKVVIKDNYLNVAVGSNKYKYPSNLTVCSLNRVIKIDGLSAGSQIGVNANNHIDNVGADHVVVSAGATADQLQYFFSDEGHDVIFADNQIKVDARQHDGAAYHTNDSTAADWIAANSNLVTAPTADGTYYLQADLHLGTVQMLNNLQNITICLNGYKIYAPAGARSFRMNNGANLTICDCTAHETEGEYVAGKLIPAAASGGVVGMYVAADEETDTVFTLRDGIIDGTGVINTNDAGAVMVSYNNLAAKCNAVFNMLGGEIRNCTARNGGAVYVNQLGVANISGGKITGNHATGNGGGIYAEDGVLNVSAKAAITGNTAAGADQNIYMKQDKAETDLSKLTPGTNWEVSANTQLDLNGGSLAEGVKLVGAAGGTTEAKVVDTTLTYESDRPLVISKENLENVTIPSAYKVGNRRYVAIDTGDAYEIHRVQLAVSAKALRPTNDGIGFKVKFSAASSLTTEQLLAGFGMSFKVVDSNDVPVKIKDKGGNLIDFDVTWDLMDNGENSIEKMENGQELTLVIRDFLEEYPELAGNTVVGTPFIKLANGEEVIVETTGKPIEIKFKDMVKFAEDSWNNGMRDVQKTAIAEMYNRHEKTMSQWNDVPMTNIQALAAELKAAQQ